jgi:hypothetical protein
MGFVSWDFLSSDLSPSHLSHLLKGTRCTRFPAQNGGSGLYCLIIACPFTASESGVLVRALSGYRPMVAFLIGNWKPFIEQYQMWNVLFDMIRPERGLAVSDVRDSQNFSCDVQDPCRSMPGNRNRNMDLGIELKSISLKRTGGCQRRAIKLSKLIHVTIERAIR